MAERDEILAVLEYLAAAYPAHVPKPQTIDVFLAQLEDVRGDALTAGAKRHVRDSRWFPTVAELREQAIAAAAEIGTASTARDAMGYTSRLLGHEAPEPCAETLALLAELSPGVPVEAWTRAGRWIDTGTGHIWVECGGADLRGRVAEPDLPEWVHA